MLDLYCNIISYLITILYTLEILLQVIYGTSKM
jgi:hypothetical protein